MSIIATSEEKFGLSD